MELPPLCQAATVHPLPCTEAAHVTPVKQQGSSTARGIHSCQLKDRNNCCLLLPLFLLLLRSPCHLKCICLSWVSPLQRMSHCYVDSKQLNNWSLEHRYPTIEQFDTILARLPITKTNFESRGAVLPVEYSWCNTPSNDFRDRLFLRLWLTTSSTCKKPVESTTHSLYWSAGHQSGVSDWKEHGGGWGLHLVGIDSAARVI